MNGVEIRMRFQRINPALIDVRLFDIRVSDDNQSLAHYSFLSGVKRCMCLFLSDFRFNDIFFCNRTGYIKKLSAFPSSCKPFF